MDICTGYDKNSIHQLEKKDISNGTKYKIYPLTYVQAVYDARNGRRLDTLLDQCNSIYVYWKGSVEQTRLALPMFMRRKGIIITYRNAEDEVITEKSIYDDCIADDVWGLDAYWVRITDALPITGNVTIGSNGNWFVNGEDTGFKAQGPKGENGLPLQPRLSEDKTKIEFTYDGNTWYELFPLTLVTPTIDISETVALEPGATPTVANVGDDFNVNLEFSLPKAPEVNVGSTTTIGEGNQAKVTNSGTKYAPVLNFEIPKGDTGRGINIKGFYPDLPTLQEKVTEPAIGDVYCVGSAEPYEGYVWTNVYSSETQSATPAWQSLGQINKDTTVIVNDLGDREDVAMSQKGASENIINIKNNFFEIKKIKETTINAISTFSNSIISLYIGNKIKESYTITRFCNTSEYRRLSIFDNEQNEIIDYFISQSNVYSDIEYIEKTSSTGEILKAYIDWSKFNGEQTGITTEDILCSNKCYNIYDFFNLITTESRINNLYKYGNWLIIEPDYYPTNEELSFISSICAISIDGNIDYNSKYSFAAVANSDTVRQFRLFKGNEGSDSVEIASAYWNAKLEGIKEINLSEHNASGITAKITINFDIFTDISITGLFANKVSVNMIKSTNKCNYITINKISENSNNHNGKFMYLELNNDIIKKIDDAIIDISLFGNIDPGDILCIGALSNTSNQRTFRVFKKDETYTEVCNSYSDQCSPLDSIETFILKEYNQSGIYGIVTIDWGKIGEQSYTNMFDYGYFYKNALKNIFYNNIKINNRIILSDLKKCRIDGFVYQNNILENNTTGVSLARIRYPIRFQDDKFIVSALIKIKDVSDFSLFLGRTDNIAGTVGKIYKDNDNIFLQIYKCNTDTNFVESSIQKVLVDFNIHNNDILLIKIVKDVNNIQFSVQNDKGESSKIESSNISNIGSGWGIPSINIESGNIQCLKFSYISNFKKNVKLVVFGDSFIEGNSLSNKNDRYIIKFAQAIGEDEVAILGKGGESTTSILSRFYYQILNYSKATYCLVALGTNDNDLEISKSNIKNMIAINKALGIKSILTTIPPRVGEDTWNNDFMLPYNEYIRSLGELYIDISKIVTSDDTYLTWKEGYVLSDGVHPSTIAHNNIYQNLLIILNDLIN